MVISPKQSLMPSQKNECTRVCYFNVADTEYPVASIQLQVYRGSATALAAAGIVAAFKHLWGESWGPRLEHFLFHGVAALLESPRPTLIDLARIYTDEDFRSRIVPRISDPVIARFWTQEFASYDQRFQAEAASPFSTRSASSLPHRHCAISWGKWRRNSTLHTRWTIAASSLRTSRKDR
jgi:hypothetical protein